MSVLQLGPRISAGRESVVVYVLAHERGAFACSLGVGRERQSNRLRTLPYTTELAI